MHFFQVFGSQGLSAFAGYSLIESQLCRLSLMLQVIYQENHTGWCLTFIGLSAIPASVLGSFLDHDGEVYRTYVPAVDRLSYIRVGFMEFGSEMQPGMRILTASYRPSSMRPGRRYLLTR